MVAPTRPAPPAPARPDRVSNAWQDAVDQLVINWKLTADLDNTVYTVNADPRAGLGFIRQNDLWVNPVKQTVAVFDITSGWQFLDALALFDKIPVDLDEIEKTKVKSKALRDRPATQPEEVW